MRCLLRCQWSLLLAIGVAAVWAGQASAQSVSYSYDAMGRLTGASYNNGSTITYAYDAAGNRTSVVTNTGVAAKVVTISSSGNNLNIWNNLVASGQATAGNPGNWSVTISGNWGTSSASLAAVDAGNFPAGSVLTVTLTGKVSGNYTAASLPVGTSYQFINKGAVTGTITQ